MAYADEPQPSSNKTVLMVLGILGGIFLLVVLICAGVVVFVISAMKPAIEQGMQMAQTLAQGMEAGRTFLEELRKDRLDAAYSMTTEAYQKRVSRQQFEELLAAHPELKQGGPIQAEDLRFTGSTPTTPRFICTITPSEGKPLDVHLTLVREGEVMRIDNFVVEPAGQSEPAGGEKPVQPSRKKPAERNPDASKEK